MKMKMPRLISRKKLRATVARRSLRASAETYDDLAEPNMKLSRALLIVLVLHVVAVLGIVAFNAIKTRQDAYVKRPEKATAGAQPEIDSASAPEKAAPKENMRPTNSTALSSQVSTRPPAKSVAKDEHKTDRVKAAEHSVIDSGKSYIVVKGDNPVTISKKFKVSYDELIALNHIDDPRKLKIGQKLLIPKSAKAKKSDE